MSQVEKGMVKFIPNSECFLVCKLFYAIYQERKGLCRCAGHFSTALHNTPHRCAGYFHADVQATSIMMCTQFHTDVQHTSFRCITPFKYSTKKGSLVRWCLCILSIIVCPRKTMNATPRRQYHIFCRKYKIRLCISNPLPGLSIA